MSLNPCSILLVVNRNESVFDEFESLFDMVRATLILHTGASDG